MESQHEYDQRCLTEAYRHEQEVEHAPLADRKEAQQAFGRAMSEDPALVAERLGWLLGGNYGRGEMMKARQILASPRMNKVAILTQLVGMYEWMCPQRMSVAAWKKLTPAQKRALDHAIEVVIENAEKDEG